MRLPESNMHSLQPETVMDIGTKHSVPCKGDLPPLTAAQEDVYINEAPLWELRRDGIHRIQRQFAFKTYLEGVLFILPIAQLSDKENHHPDIHVYYKKVVVEFHTSAILGLSENDFIMAAKIDALYEKRESFAA